ncbi:MAG: response regulator [Sphingomonadales bacterium]|nr:MAG: response regulator [Sphingomonadales bacterium]
MSRPLSILIVEDEAMVALGLSFALEDAGATVVGPAVSTVEALELLAQAVVDAAILDVNLTDRDITPVALALIDRDVPILFHTGTGLPPQFADAYPDLQVIMKPNAPAAVIARLLSRLPAVG